MSRRRIGSYLWLAMASCVPATDESPLTRAPSPAVAPEPATPTAPPREPEGVELVVADGRTIPPGLLLGVLWGNEDAEPQIEVSPLATTTRADGSLQIVELPKPPPAMLRRVDGVDFAIGLIIAFHDDNGDGTFTPAPVKPWRWPEFRGGVQEHALVYTSGPILAGMRLHRRVGELPGGLHVMQVGLTAVCKGDGCAGHDEMSLDPRPRRMTLVLPTVPGDYRFPNLD